MSRSDRTTVIQGLIDRLAAGDEAARAALLDCACERLTRLARKMLRGYPGVRRWEQTDDVLQNALIRMDRALKSVVPSSSRDFFRLAAAQLRRELIDLARRYSRWPASGVQSESQDGSSHEDGLAGGAREPADAAHDPGQLALWTEFHTGIEGLTAEDREVFDLLWYQGLTQAEAAAVLCVSERTVGRRWVTARMSLFRVLGGQLPEL